jgi:RNA polymerase sigma-70 factor (ECF subfamily)
MPDEPFDEWCRRLAESDRSAFEQVFRTLHDPLFRYVRSIVQDDAVASDVVQDVFVKLWEARETLDASQSLEAYVYRMARNRAYNHHRDRRTRTDKEDDVRDEAVGAPAHPAAPDEALDAQILEDNIDTWIQDLPDRQREALVLSRFQGLSHEAIADVMEISPRTVNNHIVRALRALREQLRAFEPSLLDS